MRIMFLIMLACASMLKSEEVVPSVLLLKAFSESETKRDDRALEFLVQYQLTLLRIISEEFNEGAVSKSAGAKLAMEDTKKLRKRGSSLPLFFRRFGWEKLTKPVKGELKGGSHGVYLVSDSGIRYSLVASRQKMKFFSNKIKSGENIVSIADAICSFEMRKSVLRGAYGGFDKVLIIE